MDNRKLPYWSCRVLDTSGSESDEMTRKPAKPRTILFDVDGVLAEFDVGYRKMLGLPPKKQEPETWNWEIKEGCTLAQVTKAWDEIKESETFWYDLPCRIPIETRDRINDLVYDHHVYFVTNRMGVNCKKQTEDWLDKHYITERPTVVITSRKGDFAAAVNADYAIDDKAGNVVYGAYAAPACKWFVLDYPYNRFDASILGSKVERVVNVEAFLDSIR